MSIDISIIIPVYRAQDTLERCVNSALAQGDSAQIVLVDDGSPDNSGALCDDYAARYERVLAVHRENGGPSAARNTGLHRAGGEYVQFMDGDDWLEPGATPKLLHAMQRSGAGLAVCSFNRVVGGEKQPVTLGITGEQPPDRQLMEFAYGLSDALLRFGSCCNKLYRRDVIDAHGLRFEEGLRVNEDAHFNFAYIRHIQSCYFIDEPLYNYVVPSRRASVTTAYRADAFELNERVYAAIEAAIGDKLDAPERRVFNRHYIDKTLIVLKMLCRENDVYSDEQLREKVRAIVDHPKLRAALADYHGEGTQENAAVELLAARDYSGVVAYAREGAKRLYAP